MTFLAFLGIKDVEFVYAEGLAMGDAKKQVALAKARIVLEKIVNAATANGEPALAGIRQDNVSKPTRRELTLRSERKERKHRTTIGR